MTPRRLLVVDDEPDLVAFVKAACSDRDITIEAAASGEEALQRVREAPPDGILLDVVLPDIDGLETLRRLGRAGIHVPTVIITSHATMEITVQAMKEGAHDFLTKPFRVAQLVAVVDRMLPGERPTFALAEVLVDSAAESPASVLVGRSPAIVEVYKTIGRVAATQATVLVVGESGTGKELVARAIHQHSGRPGAFLAANCAAVPEGLLESEFFGHERGAFTGADRRKIGKFERAEGGTLLLDEVGDMPLSLQAKMLRVLEERAIERLGGTESIPVDVRLIAATLRDLDEQVAASRFRDDVYYRLAEISIRLPPLRARREDLRLLVNYFVNRLGPTVGRHVVAVAPDVYDRLEEYHWPGNVRQLRNVLEQSLVFGRGPTLTADDLPDLQAGPQRHPLPPVDRPRPDRRLEQLEREHIARVLAEVRWNRSEAARRLGIHRNTVLRKVREYGLEPPA